MSQADWTSLKNANETQNVSAASFGAADMGVPFVRVVQNDTILVCAKNYLDLCENLPQQVVSHSSQIRNVGNLPDDLLSVERGVEVLCAAYATASFNKNSEVCRDIEKELLSLSGFYQKQVASAYFSACNILLDADEVADKPKVLKQLKESRDALQAVHYAWPMVDENDCLISFFEKVDFYGCQLGIDGRVHPEKKAEKVSVLSHFSPKIAINERCA